MSAYLSITSPWAVRLLWALLFWGLLALPRTAQAQGWRICANEGQVCRMDVRGVVRYGVDGQWSTRVMSGRVNCDNDIFGDPAPQLPKRCELRDIASAGWAFCAAEGETCHLRGTAEVRFGADRQYTTRRATGSIRCDVEAFGDPVYGQTKHCEVRTSAALGPSGGRDAWAGSERYNDITRWRQCASEGQTCNVPGRSEVRFGDGRRFATRTVNGPVLCATSVFGDPAFGVVKQCEMRFAGFAGAGGAADSVPQDGGWTRCADEGQRCDVSGSRIQVRFGTRGRYIYRDAYGALNCDIASFGSDPYPGEVKQCEIKR